MKDARKGKQEGSPLKFSFRGVSVSSAHPPLIINKSHSDTESIRNKDTKRDE